MATFAIEDRIRVTDQSSKFRNLFGTVVGHDGDQVLVNVDGQRSRNWATFELKSLKHTDQERQYLDTP